MSCANKLKCTHHEKHDFCGSIKWIFSEFYDKLLHLLWSDSEIELDSSDIKACFDAFIYDLNACDDVVDKGITGTARKPSLYFPPASTPQPCNCDLVPFSYPIRPLITHVFFLLCFGSSARLPSTICR